jgi:DNA processing protein
MDNEHIRAHIALNLVPGLGANRIIKLTQVFSHPQQVFEASIAQLRQVPGIGARTAESIKSFSSWPEVDKALRIVEDTDVWMMTIDDPEYPKRLRHIYDPPSLLWGRGSKEALSQAGVAVIGTRKPGAYGQQTARNFSASLSERGLSVISGLAYGIDTLAHAACVEAGGTTVAVLGSGINRIYPGTNRRLADKIIQTGGCIISEFVPDTAPDRENFPVRNRVVSGLSLGVLVVESDVTGGSMITAYAALDQGREVFAVPHDISNPGGRGGNTLIKKGHAKLCMHIDDLTEELAGVLPAGHAAAVKVASEKNPLHTPELFPDKNEASEPAAPSQGKAKWLQDESLRDELKQLCEALNSDPLHLDDLAEVLNQPGHQLLPALLELELMGYVKARSGKRFQLEY